MAKKKILTGLNRVKSFEITKDGIPGYGVDTEKAFIIEGAQKITRDVKTQTTDIPADDDPAYDVITGVTSADPQMGSAKLDLEGKAKLGSGGYGDGTGGYPYGLESSGKTFAVTLQCKYNNQASRLIKSLKFTPGPISDGGFPTRDGQNYVKQLIPGTFGRRALDSKHVIGMDSKAAQLMIYH
jgi:hypothetical protein